MGDRCVNCEAPADHRHHVVPLHAGGNDRDSNLVPLCTDCHTLAHRAAPNSTYRSRVFDLEEELRYAQRREARLQTRLSKHGHIAEGCCDRA